MSVSFSSFLTFIFSPFVQLCVSVSTISFQVDFISITRCLRSPLVQKIVIPTQQQGEKSRDPQWDEFIRSVGQLGQLIMLLSRRQGGGGGKRRVQRGEERSGVRERSEGCREKM